MSSLDADAILDGTPDSIREKLSAVKVFAEVDSTNSYLMQMPAPEPGEMSVALTSNQTAGRGRHGKTWQSPPGSGLCMSVAYTFDRKPENLPALTLALGLGAIRALQESGAEGVELKWPNDLVANDGKLGGILTEVQKQSATTVSVVTGIGINVDLQGELDFGVETDWARRVVDLKSVSSDRPDMNNLASRLTSHLFESLSEYETSGFAASVDEWSGYDWLKGRELTIDTGSEQVTGIGAGVAEDGALLLETLETRLRRITSGTIVIAGRRDTS